VIPLSGRVPARASGPSRSRVNDGSGLQYISRKIDRGFRFSCRGEYIGRRTASGGGLGGPTTWWHGPGVGRATLWCGCPLAPLRLCFGLCLVSEKIGTSAFVSSNSENISCIAFLKHKTAKNRELVLWHLINRLVPENA
jgi:hypothetical protein